MTYFQNFRKLNKFNEFKKNSVCVNCLHFSYIALCITRKLSYRKDDRAMRPMGALKIFGSH